MGCCSRSNLLKGVFTMLIDLLMQDFLSEFTHAQHCSETGGVINKIVEVLRISVTALEHEFFWKNTVQLSENDALLSMARQVGHPKQPFVLLALKVR